MNDKVYNYSSSYDKGYVLFVDILGFSKISEDKANYDKIKKTMNCIINTKRIYEMNGSPLRITIASDSVLVTLKYDGKECKTEFFNSMVDYALAIRKIVIQNLDVDIRAVISYGEYVHCGENNSIFFGPGITRVVVLEKSKECINDDIIADNPASILIDREIICAKELKDEFLCLDLNNLYYYPLNKGYYVVNPYYQEFKESFDNQDMDSFVQKEEEYLNIKLSNKDYGNKYSLNRFLLSKIQ